MALPTSKSGKVTPGEFFQHASVINNLADRLGTFTNPVTDANAARPDLSTVFWDTATDPVNWRPGDFNFQPGSTYNLVAIDDTVMGTDQNEWTFAGTWGTSSFDRWSNSTSATATISFTGTSFELFGTKDAHHGNLKIVIDGGTPQYADSYSEIRVKESSLFKVTDLSDSTHTVVISPAGTANTNSTGTVISVDFAIVPTAEDVVNPPPTDPTDPPTDPTPEPQTGLLPYAPPNVTWQEVHINNNSGTVDSQNVRSITFNSSANIHLIFDEAITHRLRVYGGNNLMIRGGEFNINVENAPPGATAASAYDVDCALEPWGWTGTVFIEGLWIHGPYALDSIRSGALYNADVVVQNCVLDSDRILTGVTGPWDNTFHADGLQFWNGVGSLNVYNTTIANPYQGGMIGDGDLSFVWGPTSFRRVNFRPGRTAGQAWKIINYVIDGENPNNLRGPFVWKDVYYLNGPNSSGGSVPWANSPTGTPGNNFTGGAFYSSFLIKTDSDGRQYAEPDMSKYPSIISNTDGTGGPGRIYQGLPPESLAGNPTRDFMTSGGTGAGLGYVSPGYGTTGNPTNPTNPTAPVIDGRIVGPTGMVSTIHPNKGSGITSVRLKLATDTAMTQNVTYTSPVTCNAQGVAKHTVTSTPGTYYFRVGVTTSSGESFDEHGTIGRVRRPDTTRNSLTFNFSACCNASDSTTMSSIANRNDDYFLHLGDLYYHDNSGEGIDNFRNRMRARLTAPNHHKLTATTIFAYKPDDHDGMTDDSEAGRNPTAWTNFNAVAREFLPFPFPAQGHYFYWDDGPCRFFCLDERSFKTAASATDNSSKTALGATQKQWLKDNITSMASNRVAVLMLGSPWVASASSGSDAWEGYTTERSELASFFVSSGKKVLAIGGDQHALSYENGSSSPGGIPVFQAAPIQNGGSHKGGPWDGRYPSSISSGTVYKQYARVVINRTATQITADYKGYSDPTTQRLSYVHTWNL